MSNRHFEDSDHAKSYARHRPVFSNEVINITMEYLREKLPASGVERMPLAVDVGCGTGQQTTALFAPHFDRILGCDVSEAQIEEAKQGRHPKNIKFRVSPAEKLPVADQSVSLILAGNALHWFDHKRFYEECDRVLVPGGVISAFAYWIKFKVANHDNSAKIDAALDELTDKLEEEGLFYPGTYMLFRRYEDQAIQIPYEENERVEGIIHEPTTTISQFLGYYRTWSIFRRMLHRKPEETEKWFSKTVDRLLEAVGTKDIDAPLAVNFETFMLLGRKPC